MRRIKRVSIVVLSIFVMFLVSGCEDAYKKSDISIVVDDNGKGYMEQEFQVSEKYFESDMCKLDGVDDFIALLDKSIDKDLGIEVSYDALDREVVGNMLNSSDNLSVTLRLRYDSYADFNSKVNKIIDSVNRSRTDVKMYDSTFGIWIKNTEVIIAEFMNDKLDKLGVTYDKNSYNYHYMITTLVKYQGEFQPDELVSVEGEIKANPLRITTWYPFNNDQMKKYNSYITKDSKISVHKSAASILDYYIVDVVATNFNKIMDVDAVNEAIVENLIKKYKDYITRELRESTRLDEKIASNNITDISQMTTEQMDRIFSSFTVAERMNSYWDLAPDAYVYLPTEELFGVDSVANDTKVYINGIKGKLQSNRYSINNDKYNIDNISTDEDANESDNKDYGVEQMDDTPKTGDRLEIIMAWLMLYMSLVGCVVLYALRKRI